MIKQEVDYMHYPNTQFNVFNSIVLGCIGFITSRESVVFSGKNENYDLIFE